MSLLAEFHLSGCGPRVATFLTLLWFALHFKLIKSILKNALSRTEFNTSDRANQTFMRMRAILFVKPRASQYKEYPWIYSKNAGSLPGPMR